MFVVDQNRIEKIKKIIEHFAHLDSRVAAIVIDPIQAFLAQGVDSNKQADVRGVITLLHELAREYNIAVILVRHWNKAVQSSAKYRGTGSMDFRNGARSVLQVLKDAEGNHYVMHDKSNYGELAPGLIFDLENGIVNWRGITDLTADDILAQSQKSGQPNKGDKLREATDFLRSQLAETRVVDVIKQRATKADISEKTLRRAKESLGVIARKVGSEWLWELPDHVAQPPEPPWDGQGQHEVEV